MILAKENIISLSKELLLPLPFRVVTTLLVCLLSLPFTQHLPNPMGLVGLMFFALILLLIWTTRHHILITPSKNKIWLYVGVLGRKIGKPRYYKELDCIFIKNIKMGQNMNSWSGQAYKRTFHSYIAFLKLSSSETIELIRFEDQKYIFDQFKNIAAILRIPLIDKTIDYHEN
ncbi:MAG: hypothetical protein HQ474_11900 [Flammeovirgaceae bacterium]|jgi:hypothetical protein|nr:hypothetical protein [Flammeovirgaceae bacterium]|tara:strand:+ start:8938 stop:9456 length:519 start_codon:yes stop_codon:yes gene_type:complete